MSLVNIPRYRDDPNYRYKMPRIQSKIEGRGNGTKTNILNMGDIARALKRPPMYTTKFFGCELGAMSKFEESEEKALINGAHTEKSLSTILDKFIELYVLCSECHLPEIDVFVRKGTLLCSCNACGYKGALDMTHKAASYMIKNPVVTTPTSAKKEKKRDGKDDRKKKKPEKKKEADNSPDEDDGEITIESTEINELITRLTAFLNNGETKTSEDFSQELHMLQLSQGFDNVCRFYIALCAIFSEQKLTIELFKEQFELVKAATSYSMTPKEMLCALETFIVTQHTSQLENFPYYCQTLYSQDLVDGNDFIRYYNKPTRYSGLLADTYLRSKDAIAPFIQWLKNDD